MKLMAQKSLTSKYLKPSALQCHLSGSHELLEDALSRSHELLEDAQKLE